MDYNSGAWIGGRAAYYVVGSGKKGPMGKEAFVFDKMADAKKFAKAHGGKAVIFGGVSIDKIMT